MKINKNLAVLVVRLIIGGLFIYAGWMKVSDMASTVGFFAQAGIPSFLAYVVGYAELLGGIAVVLGLWTELAAVGLAIIMLGAMYYSRSMGIQGVMAPLAIFAALVGLMTSGAGAWAVPMKRKVGATIA